MIIRKCAGMRRPGWKQARGRESEEAWRLENWVDLRRRGDELPWFQKKKGKKKKNRAGVAGVAHHCPSPKVWDHPCRHTVAGSGSLSPSPPRRSRF
jgi:hypothetical protein